MCSWPCFWITGCIAVLATLHLSVSMPVDGINNQFSAFDLGYNKTDSILQFLEREIAVSNTPSRITKLLHFRNASIDQDKLARKIFSQLMSAIGWSRLKKLLPMYWTKIMTIESPFNNDKERYSKCKEIFHPDHFMSNIILENLVRRKGKLHQQLSHSISKIFCNKHMDRASLHFVQSDDVISGIVIISVQEDGSVLSLANVGF